MEELLPHDVIENILERLDVKTLLKFTAVSKQWKSTIIRCRLFQTRQMLRRKQSGKTHVVFVSSYDDSASFPNIEAVRTLVVGSSVSVKIPTKWENKFYQVKTELYHCKGAYDHDRSLEAAIGA
ncbi:F-box domain-containing protein [Hirschfeldia incana]|nr:F-box domain-containing protein [Hirschfeldia incana]